jgi:glycerophosphoryl diester phosphodiesterase
MRFTPQLRELGWLVARPIAHRGLHDSNAGIIENTESAFAGAIENGYAIECDIQLSADGEAMVFHDDTVDRLAEAKGAVGAFASGALRKLKLKSSSDHMQTLDELLEQVNGRSTLVIELKSRWDGDAELAKRAVEVLGSYGGPFGLMSFDPFLLEALRELSPDVVRGIVADRATDAYYKFLPLAKRCELRTLAHVGRTEPHFVSYNWRDLPFEPITEIRQRGYPIITWTLRSKEAASRALRYCDQVTFEGYTP